MDLPDDDTDWNRWSQRGIIFRGLRVRMGAATGPSEGRHVHPVSHGL